MCKADGEELFQYALNGMSTPRNGLKGSNWYPEIGLLNVRPTEETKAGGSEIKEAGDLIAGGPPRKRATANSYAISERQASIPISTIDVSITGNKVTRTTVKRSKTAEGKHRHEQMDTGQYFWADAVPRPRTP